MKVGLSGARLRLRRRFLRVTIILTGIVGLLAIYPLTGCASLGGAPDTRATLAVTPIATATATGIAMATAKGQASPWKLVWSDEFNGPRGPLPDPNTWSPQIGGGGWPRPPTLPYHTQNPNAYPDGLVQDFSPVLTRCRIGLSLMPSTSLRCNGIPTTFTSLWMVFTMPL